MIDKILDAIETTLKIICGVFMSTIVVVLFYAVIMRYIVHRPPGWSMELGRYLFLWMVMLCAVVVTREQSHIQITFIVNLLPDKARFVWQNILRILMIGFCWVLVHQGLAIYPTVSDASSPALNISMGWLYLSVPAGGALMGIYILENLVRSVLERVRASSSGKTQPC